jgi:3-deoxy-7-phosphoheptulonate synthase
MTKQRLIELREVLHASDEPGRMTVITRFGAHEIAKHLPPLIQAVQESGKTVLWVCDPMHGNTEMTNSGLKTRKFEHILAELEQAFEIHKKMGTYLGGVHIEVTGENVTECTGGARGINEEDLKRAYRSQVDPRLNYEQALEMAMIIARRVQ